jgi:hypothetical protein
LNFGTTGALSEFGEVIEPLLALSDLSNVAVKLSALPCLMRPGDSFDDLAPFIRSVVDAFGAERSMWGSDLSRLPVPYLDWVRAGEEGFGCLSPSETRLVMGDALASWLDWPAPLRSRMTAPSS